jgi:hypothetical protein
MCVEMSPSISNLATALVEFHKECPKIPKSSKNPFLNSRYADLATILEIVQPILNNCNLAVLQMPEGEYGLTTIVTHSSGEWIRSNYTMQPLESVVDKASKEKAVTPQSLGSVITYQRRYALGAILCLNIDDDNDGNPPSGSVEQTDAPKAVKKTAKQLMEEQAAAAAASSTASASGSTSVDSVAGNGADITGIQSVSTSSPCTAAQIAEAKSLLSQWEQSKVGAVAEFTKRLLESGRSKIADLNIQECDQLIQGLRLKNIEAFFHQSLIRKAA